MSANSIRVRNNPLNLHRTTADRAAYRAENRRWHKLIAAAKSADEASRLSVERTDALAKMR